MGKDKEEDNCFGYNGLAYWVNYWCMKKVADNVKKCGNEPISYGLNSSQEFICWKKFSNYPS